MAIISEALRITLFILTILFSFPTYSQVEDEFYQDCDWFRELTTANSQSEQLEIIKENFQEHDSNQDRPCDRILFILSVNNKYIVLSKDSSQWYINPRQMINSLKVEEIDSIRIFNETDSIKLYRMNGVIIISSTNREYEERIKKIWGGKE